MRFAAILAAFALIGCATPKPEPMVRAAKLPPQTIRITTYPAGGIVDWNGNVLGPAPVDLTINPESAPGGRPVWPYDGNYYQIFRARWPGEVAFERFLNKSTIPQVIGIVDPNYRELNWGIKPLPKKIR